MTRLHRLPPVLGADFPLPLDVPFTHQQAIDAGISRHLLARLVQEKLVRRMLRGLYVAAQTPDDLLTRARGLALVTPTDAAVTDWIACWLHTGVLSPGGHVERPPVTIFRFAGKNRLRNGLAASGERTFKPEDLMVLEGVTVTTPLRTALDLGRLTHRDWALAAIDALLRGGGFSLDELVGEVERFRGQRGVVQLRELAPLGDPRAESPGESVLRLRWIDLTSLPRPEPQVSILRPDGRVLYRIDLGVRSLRFGVEYDGEQHHTEEEDRDHDAERRRVLAEHFDWIIRPVTKANVFGTTRDIERILHEGIREARARLGEGARSAG
jgi:hypothetical protein